MAMVGAIIASAVVEAEDMSLGVETAAIFMQRIVGRNHRREELAAIADRLVGLPQLALTLQNRMLAHLMVLRMPQQLGVRRPMAPRIPRQRVVARLMAPDRMGGKRTVAANLTRG
jgi:alpha-D-ribose 1-methylphosphonate 5-triphosphate synthase subunit PhnG